MLIHGKGHQVSNMCLEKTAEVSQTPKTRVKEILFHAHRNLISLAKGTKEVGQKRATCTDFASNTS